MIAGTRILEELTLRRISEGAGEQDPLASHETVAPMLAAAHATYSLPRRSGDGLLLRSEN